MVEKAVLISNIELINSILTSWLWSGFLLVREFILAKLQIKGESELLYFSWISNNLLNFGRKIVFWKQLFLEAQATFSGCLCWNKPVSQ